MRRTLEYVRRKIGAHLHHGGRRNLVSLPTLGIIVPILGNIKKGVVASVSRDRLGKMQRGNWTLERR